MGSEFEVLIQEKGHGEFYERNIGDLNGIGVLYKNLSHFRRSGEK